jgi:hypothetical protein
VSGYAWIIEMHLVIHIDNSRGLVAHFEDLMGCPMEAFWHEYTSSIEKQIGYKVERSF